MSNTVKSYDERLSSEELLLFISAKLDRLLLELEKQEKK